MRYTYRPSTLLLVAAAHLLIVALTIGQSDASQGCPFDDTSCQEYCGQQGCNVGYCGHFAWIQCICRRCGDEWNWFDKVRFTPNKTINQAELDSLRLNQTETVPLILTNSSDSPPSSGAAMVVPAASSTAGATPASPAPSPSANTKQATLTTLLIPDLSDSKLGDLNDIPDENSDKFLDYLAKNHEKLALASSARQQDGRQQQTGEPIDESGNPGDDSTTEESTPADLGTAEEPIAEESSEDPVVIHISSINHQSAPTTTSSPTSTTSGSPIANLLRASVTSAGHRNLRR